MTPFRILFIIFVLVPLIEIYFLIQVGEAIGGLLTIMLVVLTAIIGSILLRIQGIHTLQRAQRTMSQGQLPAIEMLEGLMMFISGALLLTPGFFTDAIGFIGLVPPIRRAIILWIISKNQHLNQAASTPTGPITLEGEFNRED